MKWYIENKRKMLYYPHVIGMSDEYGATINHITNDGDLYFIQSQIERYAPHSSVVLDGVCQYNELEYDIE